MKDFNLLVSSARGNEREALSELRYLLRELGDPAVMTRQSSVSGLTLAKTILDPVEVTARLRSLLAKDPWKFRYILKIKPIMSVVAGDPQLIAETIEGLVREIGPEETFRVSLQKRHSKLNSKEIIDLVAKRIPRKVDLVNPSKIVLLEILGEMAGVSIISETGILSIESEKRLSLVNVPRAGRIAPVSAA